MQLNGHSADFAIWSAHPDRIVLSLKADSASVHVTLAPDEARQLAADLLNAAAPVSAPPPTPFARVLQEANQRQNEAAESFIAALFQTARQHYDDRDFTSITPTGLAVEFSAPRPAGLPNVIPRSTIKPHMDAFCASIGAAGSSSSSAYLDLDSPDCTLTLYLYQGANPS